MCDYWNTGFSIGIKIQTFSIVSVQPCIPCKICFFDADESIVYYRVEQ